MNSVIVLNWREIEISKDSVRRLLKEPDLEVIVVDNGSDDGSKEYFRTIKDKNFKFVDLPKNMGASVGRNKGIDVSTGKNIFLLDGDILYIKGTIKEYQKILDKYKDAYCVGQNSMRLLQETGHNGVIDPMEADFSMGTNYTVEDWFPMAWTQYGLFRGNLLRKVKFTEVPPFNEAGYFFEDDWLNHEMKQLGYVPLSCSLPIYYHFAHRGYIELEKTGTENKVEERRKVFQKKWGKNNSWQEILQLTNPKRTQRN
jgi:glycosyltransferase involved in cell wall biosynthesis